MYTIYHPPYKLLDWIDIDKLNWVELSKNPNAIHLLEQNQDKIDWKYLSRNPNAVFLLEQNQDKIDWDMLSYNPYALSILEKNKDKINWDRFCEGDRIKSIAGARAISFLERNLDKLKDLGAANGWCLEWWWGDLSCNPNAIHLLEQNQEEISWPNLSTNINAIHLLEQNPDWIDWNYLCGNDNPRAIHLIEKNLDQLNDTWDGDQAYQDWSYGISRNPNAIHLIEKNLDKIEWRNVSINPNAISLLEQNPDKIHWHMLSSNPNAIHLLEQNQEKIIYHRLYDAAGEGMGEWKYYATLSTNPSIFKIDYEQLYKRIEPFHEELMQKCFHPDRVKYYLEKYDYDILEEEYMVVLQEVYEKLYTF
jgi:hypothetical protein